MAAGWSAEETNALVRIWGEADIQSQLDGVARNQSVFEKLPKHLLTWDGIVPGNSVKPKLKILLRSTEK